MADNKKEITRKEYKIQRRKDTLNCDICPPHRGENARYKKHGVKKKRKHKDL